jgi:methylated-DNA-[protein]-cysteine S-methyltransferase
VTLSTATVPTPAGPFTIIARDAAPDAPDAPATVIASGWAADASELLEHIGGPERLARSADAASLDPDALVRRDELGAITQAVRDYVDGDVRAIDAVAVEQPGGPFRERAWAQMRAIPAGAPQTYMQLAAGSGNPAAVRAAGSACARNAAALFVPCHRVLRTDGTLGGFLYGLDVKRWLLAHEAEAAG